FENAANRRPYDRALEARGQHPRIRIGRLGAVAGAQVVDLRADLLVLPQATLALVRLLRERRLRAGLVVLRPQYLVVDARDGLPGPDPRTLGHKQLANHAALFGGNLHVARGLQRARQRHVLREGLRLNGDDLDVDDTRRGSSHATRIG